MKTWKMIKELTENIDKKFKRVGEDRDLYVGVEGERIVWQGKHNELASGEPFEVYTDLVWEEIKEPVDFMTAVKSGKRIRVEHTWIYDSIYHLSKEYYSLDNLLHYLSENLGTPSINEVLTEGKFYIE